MLRKNFWPFFSIWISFFLFIVLVIIILWKSQTWEIFDSDLEDNSNWEFVTWDLSWEIVDWSDTWSIDDSFNNDSWNLPECHSSVSVWDRCWWWIVFYVWWWLWPEWYNNILVASLSDAPDRFWWLNRQESLTWALHQTDWYANTKFLANDNAPAAEYCWSKESWWFDDWYLPSSRELYQIWSNNSMIWWFTSFRYWSSTQSVDDVNNALSIYFDHWNIVRFNKREPVYVRCIRAVNF